MSQANNSINYGLPKFEFKPISQDGVAIYMYYWDLSQQKYLSAVTLKKENNSENGIFTLAEAEKVVRDYLRLGKIIKKANEDETIGDEVTGDFKGVWHLDKETYEGSGV